MDVRIIDAQFQARTPRDVPGPMVRPVVPSKLAGRRTTRRIYKRKHPPYRIWLYREPEDVLILLGRTVIATPLQAEALRLALVPPPPRTRKAGITLRNCVTNRLTCGTVPVLPNQRRPSE